MERTETLLVADLFEADTTALASIVEKYGRLVYRLAIQITKNHEDANDVMQETFLKVHESIGTFRQESAFETWLYRIVVNQGLNLVKRRDRRREFSISNEAEFDIRCDLRVHNDYRDTPHAEVEKKELQRWVTQAVDSLPAKHRTVVILHEFEGLTHPRIAAILNCSEGTVRSRLHYARRKLREMLRPYVDGVNRPRKKERD
ncbi:MAG: sigma-70 family RNA polymerase sigma factor [Candidatus Poribacteria bacterium]|nr:sigma-70 family RNA polymerase sigma factor [Candidatus Poribacteria bacterium]MDE0505114.1 sigma-70 family RNA polymerase sigma factor [Candidatus Poribacteria bacterium]